MITNHDSELIARNDASFLHEEDSKEYVNLNQFQYYTATNSWVLLVKSYSEISGKILENEIRQRGFLPVIARAQVAADLLINASEPEPLFAIICRGLSIADALQCLRYPKRFTPKSSALRQKALDSFKATNNRMKQVNRRSDLQAKKVLDLVRDEARYIFAGYHCDFTDVMFTTGASYAHAHTLAERVSEWDEPCFECPLYPAKAAPFSSGWWGYTDWNSQYAIIAHYLGYSGSIARYEAVPKSYKTYRSIAMERVTSQSHQQCVRIALEHVIKDNGLSNYAPIHNQGINGIKAGKPGYSTIDISSASDSISFWLIGNILPSEVLRDIRYARSWFVLYPDGSGELLHSVATMGNGFCFALETCVFLAIARAATRYAALWLDEEFHDEDCSAYGDDIIVPNWAYFTVVDFLTALGFIVNNDKSFSGDTPFRESCGFDWYENSFVSSIYWPRAYVNESRDSLSHLVSLQNRLFERGAGMGYFDAQSFIANQVYRIDKSLSTVSLDTFLEYNLDGRVLVSLTANPLESKHYMRYDARYDRKKTPLKSLMTFPGSKGDGIVYEEERFYVNALTPTYTNVSSNRETLDTYLYYSFLKYGPRYDSELDELLGVTSSYHTPDNCRKTKSVCVTRTRLF